jgi:hypothetical protein
MKITYGDRTFLMFSMVDMCGYAMLSLLSCERGEGLAVTALVVSAFIFFIFGISYLIKYEEESASTNDITETYHKCVWWGDW